MFYEIWNLYKKYYKHFFVQKSQKNQNKTFSKIQTSIQFPKLVKDFSKSTDMLCPHYL